MHIVENIYYYCPVLPKLNISRHSLVQIPNTEISQTFLVWYSLCSMERDGQSAMARLTDSCFPKASENKGRTAVEHNTMKHTNNLNEKLRF